MGGIQGDISLNYGYSMCNNITIRGNFMYDRAAPAQLQGPLAGGLLELEDLSTTVFGFEELEKGLNFAGGHGGMADLTVLNVAAEV